SLCVLPLPRRSTLFPYTTLFRSTVRGCAALCGAAWLAARLLRHGPVIFKFPVFPKEPLGLHDPLGSSGVLGVAVGCVALHASQRSEEHTSELQSRENLVCRLLLE